MVTPGSWQFGLIMQCHLEGKQDQESHHKTEKTHSLWQGKSKNGIWEELLFQWGVTGISDDKASEHAPDSSSRSSSTYSCCSGTNVLGGLINISLYSTCLELTNLAVENGERAAAGRQVETGQTTVCCQGATRCVVYWLLSSSSDGAAQGSQHRAAVGSHAPGDGCEELCAGIHGLVRLWPAFNLDCPQGKKRICSL